MFPRTGAGPPRRNIIRTDRRLKPSDRNERSDRGFCRNANQVRNLNQPHSCRRILRRPGRPSSWCGATSLARPPRWRRRLTIRSPENSSNGRCCATPTARPASIATPPSSRRMLTGRAYPCCVGARRQGCGRSGGTPPPYAASLTGDQSALLAGSRSHVCCRVSATALAPSAKFARFGIRRKCRLN